MISVTRRFEICYSHHLPNHIGQCKNLHGHNGIVEVEVGIDESDLDKVDLMVVDFGDLKWRCWEDILELLDHEDINVILPQPTAEAMVLWIKNRLWEVYKNRLLRVRLWETRDSYAEWRRE